MESPRNMTEDDQSKQQRGPGEDKMEKGRTTRLLLEVLRHHTYPGAARPGRRVHSEEELALRHSHPKSRPTPWLGAQRLELSLSGIPGEGP